jgi:hypothetical protein
MSQNRSLSLLTQFLTSNDVLQELDLSYTNLSTVQMSKIFTVLPGCLSLANLSVAFNTNEYSRSLE